MPQEKEKNYPSHENKKPLSIFGGDIKVESKKDGKSLTKTKELYKDLPPRSGRMFIWR